MTTAPKLRKKRANKAKAMRALRVLSFAWAPLSGFEIHLITGRSQDLGAELRELVRLGLAERCGPRDPDRYRITPAGREYLAAIYSNGPGGDSTRPGAVTHTREDPLA